MRTMMSMNICNMQDTQTFMQFGSKKNQRIPRIKEIFQTHRDRTAFSTDFRFKPGDCTEALDCVKSMTARHYNPLN